MPSRGKRRAWLVGLVCAMVLGGGAVASAGMFDYNLAAPPGQWNSRLVTHDYSYLRATIPSTPLCLSRNSGTSFCSIGTTDHHYAGSCNPASCYSFYLNQAGYSATFSVHDEWR